MRSISDFLPDRRSVEYGKVAVLYGGDNAEREISLKTGTAVFEALNSMNVDAHLLDTKTQSILELRQRGFDRAFIALHGRGGEDGIIQGALEQIGVSYTGSGVSGSAIAMDKTRTKWLWQSQHLPTPDFIEINNQEDLSLAEKQVGFPMMIKPVNEGSSLGAEKVMNTANLEKAWRAASTYDTRVMAESWIEGEEFTVSIVHTETLPPIKLRTPREFYDYEAKYIEETTEYICPCGLSEADEKAIASLAYEAFLVTGASGWGRVDLIVDDKNKPWLIEVNTVPGLTDHSLVPMSARQAGISFDQLVMLILETSINTSVLAREAVA